MKYLFIVFLFSLFACSENKQEEFPSNVISTEAMIPLLVDLQLIEGANSTNFFQGDTGYANYALMYNTIFKKHRVEKDQFDSSMAYYTLRSNELEEIYNQVVDELMKIEATEMAED